jgi:hypothetical protein
MQAEGRKNRRNRKNKTFNHKGHEGTQRMVALRGLKGITPLESWLRYKGKGPPIAEIARHPTPKSQPGFPGTPVIAGIGKRKTSHGSTRTQRIGIGTRRSPNATTETRLSWGYLSSSSLSSSSSKPPLASRSRRALSPAAPRCSPATLPSRSMTT